MNCKNCNTYLISESDYCHSCGGKIIRQRLTIKNLFEYFTETYFNYDNKFFQTILFLFKKPEEVVDSYVNGTRKKYIDPVSFLAISFTLSGFYLFFFQDKMREVMSGANFNTYQQQEKLNQAIFNFTFEYNSFLYLIIIPALAIISWIVFLDKKYNFTEHVIIYLYSMSFTSILSSLFSVLSLLIFPKNLMVFITIPYIFMFAYHLLLLKRLFSLSLKQLFIKFLYFLPLFFVFYLVSSIALVILILLTGDISFKDLIPQK